MLIRVIIGNLYSFRDKTEFNMLTGKVRMHPHHVHKLGKVEVLRAAAIYGANGAGKSNLVKALDLLRRAATSEEVPKERISPFKLGAPADLPYPHIEVEIALGKKNYLYGLELAHNRVAEEWLYESGLEGKPDSLIFERKTDEKGETKITFAAKYESNAKAKLRRELYESEILRSQGTLLWRLNQAKEVIIKEGEAVFNWIKESLIIIFPNALPMHFMAEFLYNQDFKVFTKDLISILDTGVIDFDIKEENLQYGTNKIDDYEETLDKLVSFKKMHPDEVPMMFGREYGETPSVITLENDDLIKKTLRTVHKGNLNDSVVFDFAAESDGTRKIIDHLLIFYEVICNNQTFVIDEIERSIHPALIKTILQKLMAEKEVKGQLIFTTHESNLLDLTMLRPDEIWFTEKDETGATSFYPLSDYPIRPDLDIEKGYMMGRFGAVPMLTDLKNLNWQALAHAEN